jgi:radical SAM superfamily enzyme YgiQ (UPF0313 family)
MIVFVNPRATRPKNRRFPLSVMAVGAALPEGENWEIVDGNLPDIDVLAEVEGHIERRRGTTDPVAAVAFTVMPGPQLVSAVPLAHALKAKYPHIPIVWGGNFPSLYPTPVLNSPDVDWIVRGQGEQTFVELLDVLASASASPMATIGSGRSDGGSGRMRCPSRPTIRYPSTPTCGRRSWDDAPVCTKRRLDAHTGATSAA